MPGLSQLKQFNSDIISLGDEVTVRASRGESPVKVPIPSDVKDINDSEEFVLGMPENEAPEDMSNVEEDLSDLAGLGSSSKKDSQSEAAPTFEAPDLSSLLNPIAVTDSPSNGDAMPDLSMFMEAEQPKEEIIEEAPKEISVADLGLDALLAGAGFDAPEDQEEEVEESAPAALDDFEEIGDLDSFDIPQEPVAPAAGFEAPEEAAPAQDAFSTDGLDFDTSVLDTVSGSESASDSLQDDPFAGIDTSLFETPSTVEETSDISSADDNFDVPDLGDADLGTLNNLGDTAGLDDLTPITDTDSFAEETGSDTGFDLPDDLSTSVPDGLFDSSDMELPEETENTDSGFDDFSSDSDASQDIFSTGLDDLGDLGNLDFGSSDSASDDIFADTTASSDTDIDFGSDSQNDFDVPADTDFGGDTGGLSDFNPQETESSDTGDFSFDNSDFASDFSGDNVDFGSSDSDGLDGDFGDGQEGEEGDNYGDVPMEDFDTSEMEGLDFGIPETDSQLKGEGPDLNLGGDDFDDFEIPGFSDVDTAKEEKSSTVLAKGKTKEKGKGRRSKKEDIDEADFSGALEGEDLPPNTLSDAQYKTFIKNFNEYPLNVRLAFEDFIVQDEFTDDAEFEIIEKILNKAPARQVASLLEKMMDISIPVPRDYEHRTAEEYEAYKKSLSYQLKNKIIPGILIGVVCLLVFWGLFTFSKNCIYRPLRANHFYKQGYALLEKDEYPQSEINFNRAVEYRYNKKWFYKYARGYREHRQYQRAERMYENILICFNFDKHAGLEYADMELYDLANYPKAEEIVKRDVLDHHINDADGILKLGDIYLEWGTEKDPAKLELAREQYATLIQLYKSNDLYESRMMRYFIRTDNLRQVLQLKKRFEPKEKSLGSEDWTELSGYLLDKSYGPIAPAEEYLRYQIEGLRGLLLRAVKTDKTNPVALYNLGRYYVLSGETSAIEPTFTRTIDTFNAAKTLRKRDIYKYIDSYRLLGEHYISTTDYLKAQEQLAEGISLYTAERDNAGFEGNPKIGKLYEDLANLKYFVSGEYDEALINYKSSIELENDSPAIRYKIGYIQYKKSNYAEALGSFMKAGDGNVKDKNLVQAMANTLSLRGDDYAAQGYYEQLIQKLDDEIAEKGVVFPQTNSTEYDLVNTYLTASNNYGVTLYKLAKRTGNSNLNARAIVQFSQSVRAWDALTRNQQTMVRLEGSNLAEQNIKYITNRVPDFEPAIYLDIKKTISDKEKF